MRASEQLGTRISSVSRATYPVAQQMDTCTVTDLAGKRSGPPLCTTCGKNGGNDSGVAGRIIPVGSEHTLGVFIVKRPAHVPDSMNQDLALCSSQAHQTLAIMGGGTALGRKNSQQKMHS